MLKKLKLRYNYILFIIQLVLLCYISNIITVFNGLVLLYYINTYYIFKNIYYILLKEERKEKEKNASKKN